MLNPYGKPHGWYKDCCHTQTLNTLLSDNIFSMNNDAVMELEEDFLNRRAAEVLCFYRDYSILNFHLWWFTAGYHWNEYECV